MGNNVDKLDETLMEYAPLDQEIIDNIYFIHDAFRFMDMISLACEGIIRPTNSDERNRISSLQDLGLILKATGKKLGRESTFAKILITVGELEILLGKMENNWAYDIEQYLVKPIQKCINQDADELTFLRDQIMRLRLHLRDSKIAKKPDVEKLEKDYIQKQEEMKVRLTKEKRTIAEMKKNITIILERQLEMNQNSIVHLESLVEQLKKSPRKIEIPENDSDEDIILDYHPSSHHRTSPPAHSSRQSAPPAPNYVSTSVISSGPHATSSVKENTGSLTAEKTMDLPQFPATKNKSLFARFISKKLNQGTEKPDQRKSTSIRSSNKVKGSVK